MRRDLLFSLLFLSIFALMFSAFTPLAHTTGQPPIITNTLFEGQVGWGPVDADPAVAHDSLSGELISNTYEGLIAYDGENTYVFVPLLATNVPTLQSVTMTVTNTSAVVLGGDPTDTTWTDGSTTYTVTSWTDEFADGFHQADVIVLTNGTTWHTWTVDGLSGTSTIILSLWHGQYVFNIRTTPDIYFYDSNGNHVGTFSVTDAAYSLQRYLVMDPPSQPIWMFDKPLFDLTDHTGFTDGTAMNLAHMINDSIVPDTVANTLTINTGCHFNDGDFKQILSDTWGCIGSKINTIAIDGWNGNLFDKSKYGGPFPDWWRDWAGNGTGIDYATLDPSDQLVPSAYVGTGPYHIVTIDPVNSKVILQKNPDYWRGWPATGSSGSIGTWEIDYMQEWTTRKSNALAGSVDIFNVPRSNMFELLNSITKEPDDPSIKTIKNIIPVLNLNSVQFTFNVSDKSPYVGNGSFPDGIPLDFFYNTHCRRAFAYSFDWSTYITNCYGEADYQNNWLVPGLRQDYYNPSAAPSYYASLDKAEQELKIATWGSSSVWASGFNVTMVCDAGNNDMRLACEMIRSFFATLSKYDGRSGPDFNVGVFEITWTDLIRGMTHHLLPIYPILWQAGFQDADYFARSYMHSEGGLALAEGYTADNGWGSAKDILVDTAVLTPDGNARQTIYNQVALQYYDDCPSFPITMMRGRMWMQYWVKGWHYNPMCLNPMYPSLYYYPIWKADDCWYDVSGPIAGVSDGVTSMRDIAYLIAHFNAKAPVPGLPRDPKWVGVYGANGCVDPEGNRICGMRSIAGAILHFNHHANTNTP